MNIKNLKDQHDKIYEAIKLIEDQYNSKDFDAAAIAKNISKLAGILKVHLSSEDKYLYPRLVASKDQKIKHLAETYIEEMGDLSDAYIAFKSKYNTKNKIESDLEAFKEAYVHVFKLLKERLSKEDHELYPLAKK